MNRFGHQHDDPAAEADPRVIGDVELIYFRGGRGRVVSSESTYACRRGDLVIIPPFYERERFVRPSACFAAPTVA